MPWKSTILKFFPGIFDLSIIFIFVPFSFHKKSKNVISNKISFSLTRILMGTPTCLYFRKQTSQFMRGKPTKFFKGWYMNLKENADIQLKEIVSLNLSSQCVKFLIDNSMLRKKDKCSMKRLTCHGLCTSL